jgi:hypothetical protein
MNETKSKGGNLGNVIQDYKAPTAVKARPTFTVTRKKEGTLTIKLGCMPHEYDIASCVRIGESLGRPARYIQLHVMAEDHWGKVTGATTTLMEIAGGDWVPVLTTNGLDSHLTPIDWFDANRPVPTEGWCPAPRSSK